MMVSVTLTMVLQCVVLFGITINVHALYMASAVELDSDLRVLVAIFRGNELGCTVWFWCTPFRVDLYTVEFLPLLVHPVTIAHTRPCARPVTGRRTTSS